MTQTPQRQKKTPTPAHGSDEFIPTRQSLLGRLKNWDDHDGWRDFFDTYGKLIYGLAVKSGLTDTEAQDVVQETLVAVAKAMPGFKYDPSIGSFKGWLLQVTRWRIADQFRKRPPHEVGQAFGPSPDCPVAPVPAGRRDSQDQPRTATIDRVADPNGCEFDEIWETEWKVNLLDAAIARVKRRVTPKQFQMFDLYVSQRWPMNLVKSTLGVNAAQVYMAKMRVARLIKKEIKHLESHAL